MGKLNSLPKVTWPEQGWTRTPSQVCTTVNPRLLTASLSQNEKSLHCPLNWLPDISGTSVWCCTWSCSLPVCLSALQAFPRPQTLSPWAVGAGYYSFAPPLDPFSALFHSAPGLTSLESDLWGLPLAFTGAQPLGLVGQWQGSVGKRRESRAFLHLWPLCSYPNRLLKSSFLPVSFQS